jgi:hypothetical protein
MFKFKKVQILESSEKPISKTKNWRKKLAEPNEKSVENEKIEEKKEGKSFPSLKGRPTLYCFERSDRSLPR